MVAFDSQSKLLEASVLTMKIIEITVTPNGATSIQTKGYSGADCQTASRALEQSLGIKTHEQRTAEYFQNVHNANEAQANADNKTLGGQ